MKHIIIIILLSIICSEAAAQEWASMNGPGGGFNQIVFNAKKDIFLSSTATLLRSTDNGITWKNIASPSAPKVSVWKLSIARNQDIFATTFDPFNSDTTRVWKSTDNGETWTRIWLDNVSILYILVSPDSSVYILGSQSNSMLNSFYSSHDFGKTWSFKPIAIDTSVLTIDKVNTKCWIDSNVVILIYGVGGNRLIRSTNKGDSWQYIFTFQYMSIACGKEGNIFISTDDNVYHSTDDGLHWTAIANSQVDSMTYGSLSISPSGRIFLITLKYHSYSDDNGNNWTVCPNIYPLSITGGTGINTDLDTGFYITTYDGGIAFFPIDPCEAWKPAMFPTAVVDDLICFSDKALFANSYNGGFVWQSNDAVNDWKFDTIMPFGKFIIDSPNTIYRLGSTVYRSNDIGKSWDFVSNPPSLASYVRSVVIYPNGIWFAATDGGVNVSSNNGVTWSVVNYAPLNRQVFAITRSRNGILYAGSVLNINIFRSNDTGKTWVEFPITTSNGSVESLITDAYGNVFATCDTPSYSTVYRSIDQGKTWTEFTKGLTCKIIFSVAELLDGAIAAATDSGVFILPLGGCEWQSYSNGLWTSNIISLACNSKGELFAGSSGFGVFKSTKLFNDTIKFSGVLDPGNTINFQTLAIESSFCKEVVLKNRGLKPFTINSYTVVDPTPFSLTDESAKKLPITLNPNDSVVMTICFHPLQPAVYSSGIIWNTDIDPSLCGISRTTELHGIALDKNSVASNESSANFSIQPNPIRDKAEINFTLEKSATVKIECFDLLGRSIKVLTEENYSPDRHSVSCDLSEVTEGMYIIRFETDNMHFSRSVVVIH